MTNIQIFGLKNSPASRAAERFFKERRAAFQYVDLRSKPIAPAELKRFLQRFNWELLMDTESKAYLDAGLKYLKLSEADLMTRIEREPKLLRLPLVRAPKKLSIGHDEAAWREMLELL